MSTILSRLVETINQVKLQPITDYEKNEMKNAVKRYFEILYSEES